jgi:hypothetical protein
MPAILDNPHVALNNARNLPRNRPPLRTADTTAALNSDQKKRLVAFLKARRKRAECDEFIAQNKADVFDILGKLPGGNFTQSKSMIYRADSISYQYSAQIIEMEQDIAGRKKIEQVDGSARKILKGCVKFEALD